MSSSYIRFRLPAELKDEFKELVGEGEMSQILIWLIKWYIQEERERIRMLEVEK